jgi:transposase-like protein
MEQIPRRQYTAEFKREAVKLVLEKLRTQLWWHCA